MRRRASAADRRAHLQEHAAVYRTAADVKANDSYAWTGAQRAMEECVLHSVTLDLVR